MSRRSQNSPPRPGMTWSEKHKIWVDADSRTPAERRRDEEVLHDVESDKERIDEILRSVREYGEASSVAEAATGLARTLLESLIAARRKAGLSQVEVARRMQVPQSAIGRVVGEKLRATLAHTGLFPDDDRPAAFDNRRQLPVGR